MADGEQPALSPLDDVQSLAAALRREQKKVALVQEVGRALSTVGNLDALLGLILEKVTALMEADRATLYLVSDDGSELLSKIVRGGEVVEIRLRVGEGLAGWVARTRETVSIADAYRDSRFLPAVDLATGYRTRTILAVPMIGAVGGLVGVLQVLNKVDGPFTPGDQELLHALASQAAIAIENAKLYHSLLHQNRELSEARRDLERRQRELNVLYEVEKELGRALDLDDLLARILSQAIGVLGGGGGSIALIEADGALRFRTVQGPAAADLLERKLPFGAGLIGWSIAHKTPLIVDDPASDSRHAVDLAQHAGGSPTRMLVAPLIDDDVAIGGIEIIDHTPHSRGNAAHSGGAGVIDHTPHSRGNAAHPGGAGVIDHTPHSRGNAAHPGGPAWEEPDLRLLVVIAARAASAIGFAARRQERSKSDRLAAIGRMVASLLHDLRTPMTIISGYGQLMATSDDAAQRGEHVELIQRQFDLMAAMIGEVLAFARGASDLVVRKVYVNRFAAELATQLTAATAGRNIKLKVDAQYTGVAYFDEHKLLRVFHNLSRNAVEAMPQGGKLAIEIKAQDNDLVCSIRDTGAGIPSEVQGRLFELFATGRKEGTGLGLAIVKKIVDDHRGTIRAESGPSGTTFVLQLPLQRVEYGDQ